MRHTAIALGIVLALTLAWGAVVVIAGQPDERVYDCRVAEFHPDYPPKVRDACREIIRNQLKTESVLWI